jgi:outer membrane protein assembly factor BamE
MLDTHCLRTRLSLLALVCLGLTGCGSLKGSGDKVAKAVAPYRMDVIQGNVVTREQLAVVKVGMPRGLVRDILGTSLLTSVFHADRWDYVFTLKRPGEEAQTRRVTVFFKDDALQRIDADDLPSEAEFVATLRAQPKSGPLPALEASEKSLQKFPAASTPKAEPVAGPSEPMSYPPLEPLAK